MPRYQEPTSWTPVRVQQHIDPVLLNDKRLEISHEMQEKSIAARRLASKPHRWAEAELKLTDEWAEKLFNAWQEIWGIQGFPKSHAFYRAVYDWELVILFAVRRSVFQGACRQFGIVRRNPHFYSPTLRWFAREMNKRAAKWNRRMDVDSRKTMYAAKREQETNSTTAQSAGLERPLDALGMALGQVGAVASTFTWKELETRFLEIQANATGQNVRVWFTRTEWRSGSVTTHCLLGGHKALQKSFESLSSVAARKLGHSSSEDAHEYWLNRLMEWVQETGLDRDKSIFQCATGPVYQPGPGTEQGFHTDRIAALSAMFCLELIGRGTPESAVSPPSEQSETVVRQPEPRRASQKLHKTKAELQRTRVAFGAIELSLRGAEYCAALDERKMRLPERWKEEGCPSTYTEAYKLDKWRNRIHNEKYRFQKQYDAASRADRKATIEGESSTRRTRH
jgi:hypothetical protein